MNKELYKQKLKENKVCCFDIDGVIFENNYPNYDKAIPIQSMIDNINHLYLNGYLIVLNTARGFITGEDWFTRTQQQLQYSNVHYNYLYCNKPAANYYIDDHNLNIENISELRN
jgi:hypothetical protein